MSTDAELLRRYVRDRDERAFAELVQRHLGLVYAAALRRTAGQAHLAEEVSQKVFTDLARKASSLCDHPMLIAWLHRSTRYAAVDAIRGERRRQKLKKALAVMPENGPGEIEAVEWERLRPVLDEAMDRLRASDREALLLRFFEGTSFAAMGSRLGLSENAARMRTERALGKLRTILGRSGVYSTSASLGLALENQPAIVAPAGLVAAVMRNTTTVSAVGTMTTFLMKKAILTVAGALMAGGAAVWLTTAHPEGSSGRVTPAPAPAVGRGVTPERRDSIDATRGHDALERVDELTRQVVRHRAEREEVTVAGSPPAVPSGGHRDHGRATPRDAIMTLAWAQDGADVGVLARLVCFEGEDANYAHDFWARLPENLRAQFDSPEKLYALLLAADAVMAPPPSEEVFAQFTQLLRGVDEVELVPPGFQAQGMFRFRRAEDGWKWILPPPAVRQLPRQMLDPAASKPAG